MLPRKPGGIFWTSPSFQSPGTDLLVNSSTPFMPRYFSLVGFEAKDTGEMITTWEILKTFKNKLKLSTGWLDVLFLLFGHCCCCCCCCYITSVVSDSVRPHRRQPTRLPHPWILQATLERVAISFSNAWKWKVKVKSLSCVRLFTTPWTAAYQAPPCMGFSRQVNWSGVPLPSCPILLRPHGL